MFLPLLPFCLPWYHCDRPPHIGFLVIYVTTSWWTQCTGNSADFGSTNPLWTASWASDVGPLPAGWRYETNFGSSDKKGWYADDACLHSYTTFWQYANSGPNPGDQDLFNGDAAGLSQ